MSEQPLQPLSQVPDTRHFSERRLEICNACPNYTMFICNQCGCMMPVKTKFKGSACPIGKWGAENV